MDVFCIGLFGMLVVEEGCCIVVVREEFICKLRVEFISRLGDYVKWWE